MTTQLRPYQVPIVDQVMAKILAGDPEVVLGACPGFGKTEVALEIIGRLIASGWATRALVLAHGTTVLRTNFQERLVARRPDLAPLVSVKIPHQEKAIEGQYDLVVVDEAHEFYGVEGGTVERIIKRVAPRCRFVITGSPSGFIRRGITPVLFALLDLYREGHAANVRTVLVKSAYRVGRDQWTDDGEVSAEACRVESDTAVTMARIQGALPSLGKKPTIIAARDTVMANQIARWLRGSGRGRVLVSHQREKDIGANIDAFKAGGAETLVVVRRATLGFDMPGLKNLVDLTGSRNPDRVFQMKCRVVRKPASGPCPRKTFVKAMPASMYGRPLRFFMTGVRQLAEREFFGSWDGGSLWKMKVAANREETGPGRVSKSLRPVFDSGMMLFGDGFVIGSRGQPEATLGELCGLPGYTKATQIECMGRVQSAPDWERETGVPSWTLRSRWHAGVRGADLLRPARGFITINGEARSLSAWARTVGISVSAMRNRLDSGWADPLAQRTSVKRVTAGGAEMTVREVAQRAGLTKAAIRSRARRGLSGDGLLAPSQSGRKSSVDTVTLRAMVLAGRRSRDIADALGISQALVCYHRARISENAQPGRYR
jgi:superfamily II DNA or RNA helicase